MEIDEERIVRAVRHHLESHREDIAAEAVREFARLAASTLAAMRPADPDLEAVAAAYESAARVVLRLGGVDA
jgi:hypothetical protein